MRTSLSARPPRRRLCYLTALITAALLTLFEYAHLTTSGTVSSPLGREVVLCAVGIFSVLYLALCGVCAMECAVFFFYDRCLRPRLRGRYVEPLFYTALAAPLVAYVSWRLFQGEGISKARYAAFGPYLSASLLLVLFWLACVAVIRRRDRLRSGAAVSRAWTAALSLLLLFAAAACYWVDGHLYVRLYGYAHYCLALLTVVLLQMSAANAILSRGRSAAGKCAFRLRMAAACAVTLSLAAAAAAGHAVLRHSGKVRFAVYDRSVVAGKCLTLLSRAGRSTHRDGADEVCGPWPESGMESFSGSEWFGLARGRSIIFIVMDTLRPDHMSYFGYGRRTTPNMDEFFREAVVFTRAYCQTRPQTRWSMPSMFCSQPFTVVNDDSHTGPNLSSILRESGYRTFRWTPAMRYFFWDKSGVAAGFDVDLAAETGVNAWYPPPEKVRSLIPPIAAAGRGSFFAWFHFCCIHTPYHPPEEFRRFGDDTLALYDGQVRYADHCFGELRESLEREGLWDDAVVVVTADHGELLGEGLLTAHGRKLYDAVSKVPLAIRVPGLEHREVEALVGQLDLLPTLLDCAGIESAEQFYGRNLMPLVMGGDWDRNELFLELEDKRAVIRGDWKLIYTCGSAVSELYNLRRDPAESENLVDEEPDTAEDLRGSLFSFFGSREDWIKTAGEREKQEERAAALSVLRESGNHAERLEAIDTVGLIGGLEASGTLREIAVNDADPAARERAVRALGRSGEAAGFLRERFGKEERGLVRAAIIEEIIKEPGEASPSIASDALGDASVHVRRAAARALKGGARAATLGPVLTALESETDTACRVSLIECLEGCGDAGAVEALERELAGDSLVARRAAMRALGARDEPAAAGMVIGILRGETDGMLLEHAVEAACRWRLDEAYPALIDLFFRADRDLGERIVDGLASTGSSAPFLMLAEKLRAGGPGPETDETVSFLVVLGRKLGPRSYFTGGTLRLLGDWLLCGPFPNPVTDGSRGVFDPERYAGLKTDYIGEDSASPREGDLSSGKRWRPYRVTRVVNYKGDRLPVPLSDIYDGESGGIAYAFTTISSRGPGDLYLIVGHDDGIRIWLNGEEVYSRLRWNFDRATPNAFRVRLKLGRNELLVKSANERDPWGFYVGAFDLERFLGRSLPDPAKEDKKRDR